MSHPAMLSWLQYEPGLTAPALVSGLATQDTIVPSGTEQMGTTLALILELPLPTPGFLDPEAMAAAWLGPHASHQRLPETTMGAIRNAQLPVPEMAELMRNDVFEKGLQVAFQKGSIQTHPVCRPDRLASGPAPQVVADQRWANPVKLAEQAHPALNQ